MAVLVRVLVQVVVQGVPEAHRTRLTAEQADPELRHPYQDLQSLMQGAEPVIANKHQPLQGAAVVAVLAGCA